MQKDSKKLAALLGVFPGKTLNVAGIDVKIMPMSLAHARLFSEIVSKLMPTLLAFAKEGKGDAPIDELLKEILPIAFVDLVELVDQHVDVPLKELPHHFVPGIVQAWLEESFGTEGKVKPWKDLFAAAQRKFSTTAGSSAA